MPTRSTYIHTLSSIGFTMPAKMISQYESIDELLNTLLKLKVTDEDLDQSLDDEELDLFIERRKKTKHKLRLK